MKRFVLFASVIFLTLAALACTLPGQSSGGTTPTGPAATGTATSTPDVVATMVAKGVAGTQTAMPTKEEVRLFQSTATVPPTAAQPTQAPTSGAPANQPTAKPTDTYINTIGFGTGDWLAEPGTRTADSVADCHGESTCVHISPDVQYALTDLVTEGIPVNQGAATMCSFAGGTISAEGHGSITLDPQPETGYLVFVFGENPVQGDHNVQLVVSKYNAGFGTCTRLPAGARVSEVYTLQNIATLYATNCGDGCDVARIKIWDLRNNRELLVEKGKLETAWRLISANFNLP